MQRVAVLVQDQSTFVVYRLCGLNFITSKTNSILKDGGTPLFLVLGETVVHRILGGPSVQYLLNERH